MMKLYSLKLYVFLISCLVSSGLTAQINSTPARVPFGANPDYTFGIMPANLPTGGTYGKSQHAADAYIEWKANYVVPCGGSPVQYRVKFDDPSRTVSEGIAYGMLLSAYAADKALFDGLWAYYKANTNGNGMMHWRIDGCSGVSGTNGATDAEMDAAYALLVAENQWPTINIPYDYAAEATIYINKIKQYEIHPSSYQAINGDGWGFGDNCRNPGYQSPAYYRQYGIQVPGDVAFWNSAVTGAYGLVNANAHATTGLISDWSNNNGVRNTCNGSPIGVPTDGYGYDACRNPWRMAQDVIWNDAAQAKTLCGKIATYVNGRTAVGVRGPVYQDGNLYSGNQHNASFVSTFAMAIMGTTAANQTLMNQMYTETVNVKDPIQNFTLSGYFGNTLRCVSLFMMSGNFWKIGTTSQQDIHVTQATTDVLSGSTYDFQNVISTGNKVVTFTIANKGFANLTLTGTPRVVVSGPNAAQFVVTTQPATSPLAFNTTTTFVITFTPGTTGAKTATVSIANNDPDENPYTFTVIGTGTVTATAPKIAVFYNGTAYAHASTFTMGTTATSSNNNKRFEIRNTGDAPLNISSITAAGTGYSILAPIPTSVAVGSSAYFWVRATSATAATLIGSFTINNDDVTRTAYQVNLTTSVVACGAAITTNEVFQDYEANYSNSTLHYVNAAWTELFNNPALSTANNSYAVAKFDRPAAGDYNGVRYRLCGTSNVTLTASKYIISMLVYSPVPGVPVLMNLKTQADVDNTTTYPSRSSVTVTTTKTNEWERIYFDHSSAIGVVAMQYIEVFVDPLRTKGAQTYYVDDIKLDVAPCLADIPASGILNDFDTRRNMSLPFTPAGTFNEVATNPSVGGLNTSTGVASWIRPATGTYQIIRYKVCGNNLDLSAGKTILSMLVYSPKPGIPILMSLKDGVTGTPTAIQDVTVSTTKTNTWEILYFDFTASQGLTTVKAIDLFIDPNAISVATVADRTYYIDEIRYAAALPCIAGIPATRIFQDYDSNRYLDLSFTPAGTFNDVFANPSATGINTSATVAQYIRPALATPQVIRYKSCGANIDLGPGKTLISLHIYSPNAGTQVTLSLKDAALTSLLDVNLTTTVTNAWQDLVFDCSDLLNSSSVKFLDILIDPSGSFIGTAGQRTYYIDNLQYSNVPKIDVRYNTSKITNGGNFNMGNISVGDSSQTISFTIRNNGLNDLNLTSTPKIAISGANPTQFEINQTNVNSPVTAGSSTVYTIKFKPASAGAKSALITIANNDVLFTYTLNGLGLAPEMNLRQAATNIASGTGSYSFGTIAVGSSSAVITFTIDNLGDDTLRLSGTPKIDISGINSGDFAINQATTKAKIDTANATQTTTFTITFTPAAGGARTAIISIQNNDLNENPYTFTLNGTGSCTGPTTANAGADQTICAATATLAGNVPTAGTGVWTVVSGSATITNSASATSGLTSIIVGTLTMRWTISNACGSSSDDVVITRDAVPTAANAGTDQTICATTATLAGNTATTGTGVWTLVSGVASITAPSSPASGLTGIGAAGATLRWTISNGSCAAASDDVVITRSTAPTTANAGADQNLCAATTATLAGNTATSGTGVWTVISGTATLTTASSPTSGVTGLAANGTATLRWTISNAPCAASFDEVVITTSASPTSSNAGIDQNLCAVTSAALNGNTAISGTGLWTLISGSGTITTPSSPTSGVTGLSAGSSVTLRWTISNGVCTSSFDDVTINIGSTPTASNAGPDQSLCASAATLAGNTAVTGTGTWTVTSGSATFTNANSPTTTVTGLANGVNVLRWTISSGSCTASFDEVTITVSGGITTANAGPDQNITLPATSTTLAGNTATMGTGVWTVVSGTATITTPSSPTSGVTGLGTGANVLRWTITNGGCSPSEDDVTINVGSAPSAQTITGPGTVTAGQTGVTYSVPTAPAGSTYNWTLPPGSVITSANPDSSIIVVTVGTTGGNIAVTETNPFGNTTSTVTITVNPLGYVNNLLSNALEVSPNPAEGLFTVTLKAAFQGHAEMVVRNVLGEVVYSNFTFTNGAAFDYNLDLQHLPAGVYTLEIVTDKGVGVKRLVKQ